MDYTVKMRREQAKNEEHRLSTLYAGMSDEELRVMANEAGQLSEIARRALATAIERRGLEIKLADYVPTDEPELRELVTIRNFRDLPDALLAKGALEAAGIECFLADDNMVRLDWFYSTALGGIKLRVQKEDAAEALSILSEPAPETFEMEGLGNFEQPRCPNCQSLDVVHQARLDKRFALPALALGGIPIPVPQNEWKCQSCGQEWQETPDAQPPDKPTAAL